MEENRPYEEFDKQMANMKATLGDERVYIGCKIIRAIPMDENTFLTTVKLQVIRSDRETRPGYKVTYPDGYVSWSPKETFETAYREITDGERKLI